MKQRKLKEIQYKIITSAKCFIYLYKWPLIICSKYAKSIVKFNILHVNVMKSLTQF